MKKNKMTKRCLKNTLTEVNDENTSPNRRVDLLINLALWYFNDGHDYNEGVKYLSLAMVCTTSPRADVCCMLGEYYMLNNNIKWAKFWTEKATNDQYSYDLCPESYYTWKPLLQLGQISVMEGELDEALNYALAAKCFKNINDRDDVDGLINLINELKTK